MKPRFRFRISREVFSVIAIALIFALATVFMVGTVFGFKHVDDHNFFEINKITPLGDGGVLLTVRLVDNPEIIIADLPVTVEVAENRALKVGWRYHIDYRIDNNGNYTVTNIN